MSSRKIDLVIEPTVNQVVRYLALAPSTPGAGERFQLSFEARFINRTSAALHVTQLEISFPAAPSLGTTTIAIKTLHDDWVTVTEGLDLPVGGDLPPMDFKETDNIILTSTPPPTITFKVFADGFTQPESFSFSLGRHESPVAGGAYGWVAKAHGRSYVPEQNAGAFLAGHRIDDQIQSPLGGSATPRQVLNVSTIYTYDTLA